MKIKFYIKEMLLGFSLAGVISYIFYQSKILSIGFALLGLAFPIVNIKQRTNAMKQKKMASFKNLLNTMYSILLSGKSFRNSLEQAINELRNINSHDVLLKPLYELQKDIQLGNSELIAWSDFAKKVDIESCYEFVDVLEETYAVGGQITRVIHRSCQILSDKIDLYLDLQLMISAKKFEFRLMMISPLVLLAILSKSNESYMAMLYTSIYGRIVMTGVLLSMALAYLIGKYIINIEV